MNLERTRHTDEYTQGILYLSDGTKLHTIERPWIPTTEHHGGKNRESCVPPGEYRLIPHDSHRFGKTWALVNESLNVYHYPQDDTPGRFAILIHAGNRSSDVIGCIAVGMNATDGWVGSSRKAMRVLRSILPWEEHSLRIDG